MTIYKQSRACDTLPQLEVKRGC